MDILVVSSLSYVFVAVVLALAIRKFLLVPVRLLLLISGIVLGSITLNGLDLITVPGAGIELFTGILLSMLVYDVFSRFRPMYHDSIHDHSLSILVLQLGALCLFLTLFFMLFFDFISALLFSVLLLSITQFDIDVKQMYRHFLREESVLSNVLMLALFVPLFLIQSEANALYMIGTGMGVGLLMGLLFFRLMRLSGQMGTLFLLVVATYLLAENLGGMGIVSTAVLGLFFGNTRKKQELFEFSATLAYVVEVILFVIVGIVIPVEFTPSTLLISFGAVMVYYMVRFLIINLTHFEFRERLYMSFCAPKGTFVIGLLLFLPMYPFSGIGVLVVMWSLIISFITAANERRIVG
ncbi:MAG: cation:proton antiporter [Candidatus Woesearchaeota archaeon]